MTYIPDCPLPAALSQAAGVDCEVVTGQILGMAFQLRGTGSEFDTLADIQAEATWSSFQSAVDHTKIVFTPTFAQGLIIPASERNETGRDTNESPFGTGIFNGRNTVTVTGMFKGLTYAQIEALRAYTPYSTKTRTQLKAYFIVEGKDSVSGRIKCATDGTKYFGVEIYNWSVGSKNLQGFNTQDMTPFDFVLKSDWDSNVEIVDGLDFNPFDLLVGGTSSSS